MLTYKNNMNPNDMMFLSIGLLIFAFLYIIIFYIVAEIKDRKIQDNILNHEFISVDKFEDNWIIAKYGKQGIAGYKYNDCSGCYIILIFNNAVIDDNYSNYENIYIGQSVNVCKRVHNHFNGKGNGDIYADIKYGKFAYVQFVPCDKNNLNQTEKRLISAFKATESYNNTKGGAKSI